MDHLRSIIENGEPLEVIPTGVNKKVYPDGEIKVVLFDIYGTLLISASGDIDQSVMNHENLKAAFSGAGILLNSRQGNTMGILKRILETYRQVIDKHHSILKQKGVAYPEVDICQVWQEVLVDTIGKGYLEKKDGFELEKMIFIFEWLSNKVYPMPGLKYVLERLKAKNIPMGIISNAQFYTPMMMNYFLNGHPGQPDKINGFDPDITVFSYKHLRGKPDTNLFSILPPVLKEKYNCCPKEVLFLGNDMFKDIYPAKQTGFKTALFAGDKRSLRWRKEKEEVQDCQPDFIITGLEQLFEIIS